jgi:hypothetical protein
MAIWHYLLLSLSREDYLLMVSGQHRGLLSLFASPPLWQQPALASAPKRLHCMTCFAARLL